MPPKYPNEEQNYSLFDELPEEREPLNEEAGQSPEGASPAFNFDIFNFSAEELRAIEKARAQREQEDFLALYDETPAEEPEELTESWDEPAEEETESAELPEDDESVMDDMPPEEGPAEEVPEEEVLEEIPEEIPEEKWPDEEVREAPEMSGEEAEVPAEEPEDTADIFPEPAPDETVLNDTEALEEDDRGSLASFLSLFRRKNAPAQEEREEAPEPVPEEKEEKKPGKLTVDKEKLFAMLYPTKKDEEPAGEELPVDEEDSPEEPAPKAVRVVPPATVLDPELAQLPREPKAGEMLVYDTELDDIDYYDDEDLPELRDYMPVRFARYGKLGIGGGLMYALFVISISIILACAAWLFASDVLALNKPDTTSVVTILRYIPGPEDTLNEDGDAVDEEGRVIQVDMDQVASALKSSGVIDFKWLFKLFGQVSNANVKINPGTYDVSAKLDYRALVTEMQVGSESQEITRITFPEGYNMDQIFQLLEDNGICDKDDLYEAAANYDYSYDWLDALPLGDARRLEGYLFPDTYDFYQGESAVNAIDRFLNRFHYMLTLDMLKQAENRGISLHEAVIIASLIEKEAGAEDDRSRFASVIYNRLGDGWKLQLDSTLNYIKGTSTFDLTYDDMEIDSPYNTYLYEGLPAGPICSPGKASLQAALNPASTNDWFWYAHEGVTYFFSSSSAFNEFAEAHPY